MTLLSGLQHLSGLLWHFSLQDWGDHLLALFFIAFAYGSVQEASVFFLSPRMSKRFRLQSLSFSFFSPQTTKQPALQTFN